MKGLQNLIWRGVQFVIRLGSRILVRLLSRLTIEGRENFVKIAPGPLLIIANHKSYYDPTVIAAALPFFSSFNPLRFIAKDEFFMRPFMAFIFNLMGAFPARQGQGIDRSLELPERILRAGGTVVFFPEGSCIRDDSLGEGKIGAALLATRVPGLTILPMAIFGAYRISGLRFSRPNVVIKIGEPFQLPNKGTEPDPKDLATDFMHRIKSNYLTIAK